LCQEAYSLKNRHQGVEAEQEGHSCAYAGERVREALSVLSYAIATGFNPEDGTRVCQRALCDSPGDLLKGDTAPVNAAE
jgi:hypothetical protein